ncbi:MAG: hypothetical protein IPJ34_30295 [Myxococcales bacterium]|nr:hypothetical protein [Myxococcales bacterium]
MPERLARPVLSARAVVAVVFVGTLVLARHRLLTFDEAYYLAAARDLFVRGAPPLADHPPLLLLLLSGFDRLPLPLEVRVRLVPALLAAGTALLLGALAQATGGDARRATILGSVGVLPVLGGLVATPDAPLLLGVTLLLLGAAQRRAGLAGLGAFVAGASKVSGVLAALLVALELARRDRRVALALTAGALLTLPLGLRSLVLQTAHVAGRGPLVSAPVLGAPLALVAWATAVGLLVGPALLLRVHQVSAVPGGVTLTLALVGALVASALVSGRAPEVGWIGPVLPVWIALAARPPWSRVALASYVAPTVVGALLWLAPRGPFEGRAPTRHAPTWPVAPPYGLAAWTRIYGNNPP